MALQLHEYTMQEMFQNVTSYIDMYWDQCIIDYINAIFTNDQAITI